MQPVSAADTVFRWCRVGLEALAAAREEIDALNVYPVPDRDTGTNLYRTFERAVAAAENQAHTGLADVLDAMARGALLGARGNSGVILAQMLRGVADVLGRPDVASVDGRALADGLVRAADEAVAAVGEPVDGTVLSVARAAGEAARERAFSSGAALADVATAAAAAAHEALSHTPGQLDVLGRAGVVDAGGRGLTVLLDAFDTVLTGRRSLPVPRRVGAAEQLPAPSFLPADEHAPAYEVMYLLDAPGERIGELRSALAALGDSLVVAGGGGEWNVHVHVDDAGAAVEAGVRAGRPHRISITHLAGETPRPDRAGIAEPTGARIVVALAAGDGLAELFGAAGGTVVTMSNADRPATGEIIAATDRAGAGDVVIVPNERDATPAAQAAATELRTAGRRAAVIPSVAQVQGLAALAVHDPEREFDTDVVAMTTAAAHTRHGAVTVATREAVTMAGVCRPGDALGVVEGDFAVVGTDLLEVAVDVAGRMLSAGGELVTVVTGAASDAGLAEGVVTAVRADHPEVDTVVHSGGQARYPLLLGVE